MRLIVVSPPADHPQEARVTARILQRTAAVFHLRKPDRGAAAMAACLKPIPADLHRRIMVHFHPSLLDDFDLRGIHFPEKDRLHGLKAIRELKRDRPDCRLSTACHHLADIPVADGLFDTLLLSPIFDSISKKGYRAAFDHAALKEFLACTGHTIIALGGIDERRIATAAALGFKGVAVLGAVWGAPDPAAAAARLASICCRL